VLAVAALLVGAAGPASAAEIRLADARGDMWTTGSDGQGVPAPDSNEGDLTRAKVAYRGEKVVVRLAFVDLARRGTYAQYVALLQGRRDGVVREVVLTASPSHWGGRVRVYEKDGDVVASCPVGHLIDYDRNIVRIQVARSCMHRPGSVRANVNIARADRSGAFFSDNPHDDTARSDAWTSWVRRTA
jgi:hypothetical protein